MINVEQITATNKANLDNLFGLSNKAFAGVEKIVELNLTAGRAALAESAAHAKAVLGAKDAQELVALQTSFIQPLAEKSAAYSRHIYDIASSTGADLTQGFEGKAAEGQQAIQAYIESALKNAPAGSEQAVAFFKQATDLAESQIKTATETAVKASKSVAKKR